MITVRGPGRCTACSFHVASQGHREGCDGFAPIASDGVAQSGTFLEKIRQRTCRREDLPAEMWPIAEYFGAIPSDHAERGDARAPAACTAAGTNPTYVAAAIRAELQRLTSAAEGTRNDTLHRTACSVFEFVKGKHADGRAASAELTRIAVALGLAPSEIRATLRSAWQRVGARAIPAPRGATG